MTELDVREGFKPGWALEDHQLLVILEKRISALERELALLRSGRDELAEPDEN